MKYVVFLSVLALVLCAGSAFSLTYTEQYEMNASPTTSAGTMAGNVLYLVTGFSAGTYGNEGFIYSDGIATFLDDAASSGNQGLFTGDNTQAAWLAGSSNYTVDFRIRVLQNTLPDSSGKSMSFWSGSGRGLHVDPTGVTHVSGTGFVGTANSHNFTEWTICREIVNGATNMADLYIWTGSGWWNAASTSMGGSGWYGGSTIGFALGSTSGSGTTLCNYELDYVRIYSGGTGVDTVYELIPEPGSMMALASGLIGMAGFALRRRRA